jgi:hypothetical protein
VVIMASEWRKGRRTERKLSFYVLIHFYGKYTTKVSANN